MPTRNILFATEVVDLAETHRMTSLAEACKAIGHRVTFLGEGRYEHLFADKGFERVKVAFDQEWMNDDRFRMMHDLDEHGLRWMEPPDLRRFVKEEVELLERVRPDAVVTGFRPTMSVSTKVTKTPLVWVLSAVVSDPYFETGLATLPAGVPAKAPVLRILPKGLQDVVARWVPMNFATKMPGWNDVMKEYGLKPFKSMLKVLRGDLNLMSDAPDIFPEFASDLPPYYAFCGPLLPEMHIETPESMRQYQKKEGRPVVFFSMGSSGDPAVFLEVLRSFEGRPYDVFAAYTSILPKEKIPPVSSNVVVEKFYPAAEMTRLADVAVIHGGQGTVYATAFEGTPFVGIPMFSEQQYNLENLARRKCGIVLSRYGLQASSVLDAIDQILANPSYREQAQELSTALARYRTDPQAHPPTVGMKKILSFLEQGSSSYFDAKGW